MPTFMDRRKFLRLTGGALAAGWMAARADEPAKPRKGLVVGQPEAAEVGMAVLASGGNAVDAAVAAGLVAGVGAVPSCGIGGYGGHLSIARPGRGKVRPIDFNSTAPSTARGDMFPLDTRGAVKDRMNEYGWLAAGVPGTLAGLHLALDRYGTQKFARLVEPAIRFARDGFPVKRGFATPI